MRLKKRIIVLSSVGTTLIVGASVMALSLNSPHETTVKSSEQKISMKNTDKEPIKDVDPVVEELNQAPVYVEEPTSQPVQQPAVARPTIEELADTVSFRVPEHKKYYIACAHKYDQIEGFIDQADGTREQAIVAFMQIPGYFEGSSFMVYNVSCQA